ncbi:putative ribonuclease H-like domain-containing protein [Tanacetum coccineum]
MKMEILLCQLKQALVGLDPHGSVGFSKPNLEPTKIAQALDDESWVEAMQEELLQFKIQKIWTLVDLPYGKKAIGTKWVYRNKKDERGIVVRNKARLVAQGYKKEEGIDYDKVFAHVARIKAIRKARERIFGMSTTFVSNMLALRSSLVKVQSYPLNPPNILYASLDNFTLVAIAKVSQSHKEQQFREQKDGLDHMVPQSKWFPKKVGDGLSMRRCLMCGKGFNTDASLDCSTESMRTSLRPSPRQTLMSSSLGRRFREQKFIHDFVPMDSGNKKKKKSMEPESEGKKSKRKTQKHRRTKKDTKLPQTSVPQDLGTDEAIYKEGSERVLEKPNEPPFSEGHTSGSGEGSMEYHFELTDNVSPTPYDSPLSGDNTPGSDEGRMELIKELMETCTSLTERVLALEEAKIAQDSVINRLKLRVKRLEKKRCKNFTTYEEEIV